MKSKFTLALFLLIPFFGIKGQQPIIVSEDSLNIGSSKLPAFSVTIPESEYDVVFKAWTRELESGTRSKVHTENSEMQIMGARIKDISKNAINVFSKLERLDSALILFASFEISKDQYITSTAGVPEFTEAWAFMKEFAKDRYIDVVKDQVNLEEKKLRNLERELSSLENEKSKMEKSIESDKNTIASEKENIILMNNELNTVNAALSGQDTLLAAIAEGPARKEKEGEIKDLEKRIRKAQNSIESSERKIQKCNDDIEKATSEIPQNERMQDMVRVQIAQQQNVYQKFEEKLNKIKSY
jgi:DNA repair exonuclease SbcCD ATPase subunit